MCVLLFDDFEHLLLRKTNSLKTWRKSKLFGKKIWRNAIVLKNKKVQRIFGKRFILALLSPAVFRLQTISQISFKLFLKGLYQSFLENEVDFRDIMNASPNTLAKKLRHGFVDERALITRILISSCHWKTLVPCCLKKERPENVYWIIAKSYRRTNYDIQNNSKLAI